MSGRANEGVHEQRQETGIKIRKTQEVGVKVGDGEQRLEESGRYHEAVNKPQGISDLHTKGSSAVEGADFF